MHLNLLLLYTATFGSLQAHRLVTVAADIVVLIHYVITHWALNSSVKFVVTSTQLWPCNL